MPPSSDPRPSELQPGLEALRAENRRLTEELRDFVAVGGHELKSPLNKVSAFAKLLEEERGMSAEGRENVRYLRAAVDDAGRLVDGLQEFARAGRAGGASETVDMEECAAAALDALAELSDERGAEIRMDSLPQVLGSSEDYERVYRHLLRNALLYSGGRTPRIRITAEEDAGVLGVRDEGEGIEPRFFERIFRPFERLHGASKVAGAGLGLAVCRRLVARNGGRIWVESRPRQGAWFRFSVRRS